MNGGATLTSFDSLVGISQDFVNFLQWASKLPHSRYYIEGGKSLIVSHSLILAGFGQPNEQDYALWYREPCVHDESLYEGRDYPTYNIFGHTPTEPNDMGECPPFIGKRYACIDTGAVYRGKLTALEFPSMTVISQDYID